jgi:hypothetical protein
MAEANPSSSTPRRHQRVTVKLPVRVSTIDPERDPQTGRPFFRASRELVANLSRGGLGILTTDPLPPGRRVLVEMHFPDGAPLEAVGRVAWSKTVLAPAENTDDNSIGVEFIGATPEQLERLEDFLAAEGVASE